MSGNERQLSHPADANYVPKTDIAKYGKHVYQIGGSRYESGRNVPVPTAILTSLYSEGKIYDDDLAKARSVVLG